MDGGPSGESVQLLVERTRRAPNLGRGQDKCQGKLPGRGNAQEEF